MKEQFIKILLLITVIAVILTGVILLKYWRWKH